MKAVSDEAPVTSDDPSAPTGDRRDRTTVATGATVLAFGVAVVAAVVRALTAHWYPVGDNGYFALRSYDVFTEHHPLLGTWTSASHTVGFQLNNPGPLLFDALAVPAKIDPDLLPVGVAFIVVGSVATMAWCAARVAGRRGVVLTMFASASLAWAMGPEILVDPWQPHSLLFPFLAMIGTVWASWAGSDGALLAAAGLGSLLVQTHLSYTPLVAALGASAVVALAIRAGRDPDRRPHIARVFVATFALGALLWAQPVVEELTAEGEGNLSRVLDVPGAERGDALGTRLGTQVAGTVIAPVPVWAPTSFETAFLPTPEHPALPPRFDQGPSALTARLSILATFVALAVVALVAYRRRARLVLAGTGVVTLVVAVAVLTAVTLPLSAAGLPPHHVRWLWPVGIAVTTVIVAGALHRRSGLMLVAVATVVMAALALVPTHPAIGPTADTDAGPVLRDLAPQFDALRGRGPLLLDPEGLRVFEPYSAPVMLELERRGIDVVVEHPDFIRQLGPDRAASGDEAGRFFVWQGNLAEAGRPGLERVAHVAGLDPDERAELDERTTEVVAAVAAGSLRLTPRGEVAVHEQRLRPLDELTVEESGPLSSFSQDALRSALALGWIEVTDPNVDIDRWTLLRTRFVRHTLAIWVDWTDPPQA